MLLGRMFSPCDRATYAGSGAGGVLHVWLNEGDNEGGLFIPVQVVDESEVSK